MKKKPKLWPTPDGSAAQLGEGPETWLKRREELKAKGYNGNGCGTPLSMAVQLPEYNKLIPTPTVSDHKSSCNATAKRSNPDSKHHAGTTLTDYVRLTSTCSQASGASPSQPDDRDTTPLPSAKSNPTASESSEKTSGRLWPTPNAMDSMAPRSEDALREAQQKGGCSNLKDVTAHPSLYPTSETLTAETSTESISSQVDFLASLSVMPGSAGARKMTVTSGLKCSALLKKHDPLSSWVKTLLGSSRWNSTVVFLTWKVSATPSGRCLFQLAPWEPSTDECESGLLPTINSREGGSPFDGGSNASYRKEGQTSKDMVQMWRTPNTNSLPDAIEHKMLPTPTEDDSSNVYPKDNRYGSLVATVNKETGNTPVRAVGSLNPQFVSWLMGYPLDWCDMPEESQQASPTE